MFLGSTTLLAELGQLRSAETSAVCDQTTFRHMGQTQIHIIATEHQVITHPDTSQAGSLFGCLHLDQGQISGAAANITDQQQAHIR